MQNGEQSTVRIAAHPGLILAGVALLLHLWANSGYDYFIDELNFIVCGQHLAWGYIDHPPLVPLIARIVRELFGDNLTDRRGPTYIRTSNLLAGPVPRTIGIRLSTQID